MSLYTIISLLLTLAVGIAYLNHKYVKMPPTIAIMSGALLFSLLLVINDYLIATNYLEKLKLALQHIDFHHFLMDGLLSFLLFAGGLSIDIQDLYKRKWEIATLASISTIASALCIGFALYYLLPLVSIQLSLIYCLLFGALISPTDPIAVLAMCKDNRAPQQLTMTIAGESLFNDGVGIVLFATISELAINNMTISFHNIAVLFLQQAFGGIIYGIFLGYIAYRLIKSIQDHRLAILITLAIATGGYTLGLAMHISGPLAMVVAGIFFRNYTHKLNWPEQRLHKIDEFWELIDEVLNALLFLLLGLEIIIVPVTRTELIAAIVVIPLVLFIRLITVAIPIKIFQIWRNYEKNFIRILTWGGLRGGLAVALALSIPNGVERDLILNMTYMVVIFSIIIQGMTIKPLLKKYK